MMGLMRNAIVLFAVLAFAVVLAMTGEGECGECLHGCCARGEVIRRLVSFARGVRRALGNPIVSITQRVVSRCSGLVPRTRLPIPILNEAASLRI